MTRSLIAAIALFCLAAVAARAQEPSVLVQETALRKGSLPVIVTAYGRVEPDPSARRTIMAPVAAVVRGLYVRPGQEVAENAPLILLGPSPATAAAYTQARTALAAANQLVARTQALLGQHLATRQDLAAAEKSAADARATLTELETEGAGAPQILRAPFRAIVTAITTSPGAIVAQGAALIDLARPNALVLRVGVVPEQALSIKPGEAVGITPLGAKDPAMGRVVLRGSVVDPATGLVPVGITVPPGFFLAGQMAEADIVTGKAEGYIVPHTAILVDESGAPYVVQAVNKVARKVPVRILDSVGDKNIVAGPLDPAAPLVLEGNYQLDTGMKVRVAIPARAKRS
ncbi:MAG TPA: efflux RND transporter periplasmic adaptor subunit [Stellaceae bacterium]|nr:efflux RND transporter periplasmic adaptor subunit [Stellaceae bacterium]